MSDLSKEQIIFFTSIIKDISKRCKDKIKTIPVSEEYKLGFIGAVNLFQKTFEQIQEELVE